MDALVGVWILGAQTPAAQMSSSKIYKKQQIKWFSISYQNRRKTTIMKLNGLNDRHYYYFITLH